MTTDTEGDELPVCPPNKRYYIIYISILFCNLLFSPHIRPHNIDLTTRFPHAPTRSRIAASVSKRAQATHVQYSLLSHSGQLKAQQGLGVGLCWLCGAAGTPSLFTHQFQAEPCRCSRRVASIIERIDLGCGSNLMLVLICLTAALPLISSS